MLEFEGKIKAPDIEVSVYLDSAQVGSINVTLDQWDRLRLHRTLLSGLRVTSGVTTGAATNAGVDIHVYAEGSEDRPVEAERQIP